MFTLESRKLRRSDNRLQTLGTENRMSANGDISGPRTNANALPRLLEGLPVTERRLELAGVSTSLLEGGEGPPIVLLHGIGSFAAEWAQVIPLVVRTHRVLVPDMPGLGRSEARGVRLDPATVVAWLLELIAHTCVEPPTLVGHSMGGSVAAHFAIEHGDRVRRVVLVDPSSLGRFRPSLGVIVALLRFGARPSSASRDRFLRRVLVDPERARARWGDRWGALEAYDIEQAGLKSVNAANGQLMRRIGSRRIPPDRLRTISVPVALIWGRGDRLMHFRIAEKAAAQFGWPLYPIDDCGHGPHIERPDAFLEALGAAVDARPS